LSVLTTIRLPRTESAAPDSTEDEATAATRDRSRGADQPLGLGLVAGDEDHRLALPGAGPGFADLGVGAVRDPQQPPGQDLVPGMVDDQGAGAAHGLHLAAVPDLDVVATAHPAVAGPAMRQPEPVRTKVKDSRASTGLASWCSNLYLTSTGASCTCSAR
jgi:hypothetical protein